MGCQPSRLLSGTGTGWLYHFPQHFAPMKTSRTALIYDDMFLHHDPGRWHPESPARLRMIMTSLRASGVDKELVKITPTPAPVDMLSRVHSPGYINHIRRAVENAPAALDPDTAVSARSWDAALLAAGSAMAAVDAVIEGSVSNAFCAVRPPGHHACRHRAMGFCLFNNIAVAARHALTAHGLSRVLIVDWDAHHGNGTQEVFYEDSSVLYFSVHQFPAFPGTGTARERGSGGGEGYTINVPVPPGSGDEVFMAAFREMLLPAAERFAPELVLVSAGFDAYKEDTLTNLGVTVEGFCAFTGLVRELAGKLCNGRIVSLLEGGYHLPTLGAAVLTHLNVLAGTPS